MPVIKVSEEAYARILKEAAIDGHSLGAGLDRLIAILEVKAEAAEKKYNDTIRSYPCCECGKEITLTKENVLNAFKNWGHAACVDKAVKK